MLYIKFTITELEKFKDFKVVYNHMDAFRIGEYEEEKLEIDWETATEEEIDAYFDEDRPKRKLFDTLFPEYAKQFLERYFSLENAKSQLINEYNLSLLNYLEDGFEVNLDSLEKTENNKGIVKFSTGNYPFGGIDRFLMTLKAFDLQPTECFGGFDVFEFNWTSDFEYEAQILEEKTKLYLKR
ncbi:hypothetical protein [Polaribacter sp. Asnod6-C07]|uniref:hypothetical protein n=1 Tax=Polaribacter sp. Asnod6-C07 TaxID=3160582 RepID=UPI003864623F